MKSIHLVKTLINITYYLLLFGLLLYPIYIIFGLFFIEGIDDFIDNEGRSTFLKFDCSRSFIVPLAIKVYVGLILDFIKTLLFFFAIFFLGKAVLKMVTEDMYNEVVLKSFVLSGKVIIGYAMFLVIANAFFEVLYNDVVFVSVNFYAFNSFFVITIIGLAFLFISSVIERGIQFKRKNGLTI